MNHEKHERHEKKGKGLVPRLRFPEFTKEWRHTTIGEIFNTDDKPVKATRFENDKILTVRLHVNGVVRNERTSALTGGSNYFKRRPGQFIFSKIDLLNGAFGIVPEEFDGFYSSSDVPAFSFGTEHSPTFFLNWLSAKYQCLDIERTGTSATLKRVSPEKFWGTPILLPSPLEQQKIADCLSSLDGVIAAEGRKLVALRDHKRGLMQQLFPGTPSLGAPTSSSAGGESAGGDAGAPSQPRLRFPEFRDKGAWGFRELSDFITERNQYPTEKVPLFSLTIEDGVTPKTERYERSFLVNDETNAYKLMLPNDFAFNPMNLRFGAIGRHSGTEKVAVSKYYNIFSCDRTVDSRFCEMYFRSNEMIAFYDNMAIGSLIEKRRVHFAAFLKFNIRFPCLPEQQRIANCLTTLDIQITAQAAKIETLKQHKRGLMQQLFPAPEEVEV